MHCLPLLPREHVKVVFRPQGGLDVSKISAAIRRSATLFAATITKLQASEDILCPNAARNVFVMSPPSIERAKTYSMVRQLNIANRAYSTLPYVAFPEDTCKGVIHGIPPEGPPPDIIENIVNSANPQAKHARRMGTTNTSLIAFDGPKVPLLIYCQIAEFRCYIPKKNRKHVWPAEHLGIGLTSAQIQHLAAARDVGSTPQKTTHIRAGLNARSARKTTLLETKGARDASSHRLFQASHPTSRYQGKTVPSIHQRPVGGQRRQAYASRGPPRPTFGDIPKASKI
ncbi:hypothetical protein HPB48_025138 [Haemaphysalis longicornis]|uniref:Uncharacterized protein n=1 Tax=Haemaphysalis longicornis TaxID=44386 RepID=A0A9J6H9H3_HAELO|nr:hypothetical protein HPB48_025138 [Haemaphysalis longicornis]